MNDNPPLLNVPPPPPPPYVPAPVAAGQPRRTGWIVFAVVVCFLLVISLMINMGLLASLGGKSAAHGIPLEEQFVDGNPHAKDKIVVISLAGVISSSTEGSVSEDGMVGEIRDQLLQALDDKKVRAIILRINSPGGEVVASDAIYQAVAKARDEKPVIAIIETMGASGAYYAAMGSSHVIAHDLSITGSIGVIMQSFTFGGYEGSLMGKVGVKSYTFKSGRYKDLLNPTREATDEEKQLINEMIMEVYEKFVGIVAAEREIDVEKLRTGLADGRIFSGKQALANGLVDELGYFEDAIERAKALARIEDARVIRYTMPFSLQNLLRIFGETEQGRITSRHRLQLELVPNPLRMEAGKMYFLPPYMFQ
jgi:protease-4